MERNLNGERLEPGWSPRCGPVPDRFFPRATGGRLLVVDDEPLVGRAIASAAEACGFNAALAISAAAFREQYESDPPDIVLLDLSLPGCDGVELLRVLAELGSQSLILIVSGFDARVVEASMRLGSAIGLRMGGYLTKPVTVRQLADALAAAGDVAAQGAAHELCHG
jgi:DNA-binding response OmpR family regulator